MTEPSPRGKSGRGGSWWVLPWALARRMANLVIRSKAGRSMAVQWVERSTQAPGAAHSLHLRGRTDRFCWNYRFFSTDARRGRPSCLFSAATFWEDRLKARLTLFTKRGSCDDGFAILFWAMGLIMSATNPAKSLPHRSSNGRAIWLACFRCSRRTKYLPVEDNQPQDGADYGGSVFGYRMQGRDVPLF